jgi:hypothetical protein
MTHANRRLFLALLIAAAWSFLAPLRAGESDSGKPDPKDLKAIAELRPVQSREPRAWISPEYVRYSQNDTAPLPLLLTRTTPASIANIGSVPGPGTSTVYGQNRLGFKDGNGVRLSAGGWFDRDEKVGLEVSGFYIPKQTQTTTVSSNGSDGLAAPYADYNPAGGNTPGTIATIPIAGLFDTYGPASGGQASFRATTEQYGGEANLLVHLAGSPAGDSVRFNADLLAGFRYLGLKEEFDDAYAGEVVQSSSLTTTFGASDRFRTDNNFYGGNLGFHFRAAYDKFFAEFTPKIGLGVMDESVDVGGSAFSTGSGMFQGYALGLTGNPGGLYATGNKLGARSADRFAYLPQITLKLGYEFTPWLDGFLAYDALYVSQLARAVGQIDTNIDSGTAALGNYSPTGDGGVLGAADHSPAPGVNASSMFEQGLTAGLTFKL